MNSTRKRWTKPALPWAVIAVVSGPLLLAAGVAEPDGFRMDHYRAPVPDTVRGGTVLHVDGVAKLLARGDAVLIDVLPAPIRPPDARPGQIWLPVPHRDLPGSLWLPDVGRGGVSPALGLWFKARLSEATKGDLDRKIVFYCLSQCWMSWNATKRAISYGYRRAIWFPEGADGWEAAGMPTAMAKPLAPPP